MNVICCRFAPLSIKVMLRKWVPCAATDKFERRQMCSLSCIGGGRAARGAKAANVSLSPHGSDWLERRERKKRQLCFARSFSHQPLSLSPSPRLYTHSVQRLLVGKVGTCQRCSTSAHRVAREHQRAPAMVSAMEQRLPKEIECSWTRTWVRRPCEEVGRGEGAPSLKTHPSRKQGETISK